MSTLAEVTVPCGGCRAAVKGEIAIVANLGRMPALREQILGRTLNVLTCGACGHRTAVLRTVATVDFERAEWVICYPGWAEVHWADLASAARKQFEKVVLEGAPEAIRADADRWKLRVVFGAEMLRDKVVASMAGIDDVALEWAKLAAVQGRPEWASGWASLDRVDGDALLVWMFPQDRPRELVSVPRRWLSERPPVPGFLPEVLRADAFVSFRRYLVAPKGADPLQFDLDAQRYEHAGGPVRSRWSSSGG